MTCWTAIVPIKPVAIRKTRLHSHYSRAQITELTNAMLSRVLGELAKCSRVTNVVVLGAEIPDGWTGAAWTDEAGDLNLALNAAAAQVPERLLIVHADLPSLGAVDIQELIECAERQGIAVAPDRSGSGTNAIALVDPAAVTFAFGLNSFTRHKALFPGCAVVRRPGLQFDVDLPVDAAEAIQRRLATAFPG